jgi:hypothetical protein
MKPKKETIMVRYPMDADTHDKAWGIYMRKPKGVKFEQVLLEIAREGVEAIIKKEKI